MELLLNVFNPLTLLVMSAGVTYGIIFGSIPGLSSSVAVAIIIPLTFGLEPLLAINLMIAVYVGGVSGGLISATMLRIPGTPSSIVTTFDGYPMAQQGLAGKAIGLGIFSSVTGGLIGAMFLLLLSGPLSRLTIQFGPFDYFGVTMFSLSLVVLLIEGNPLKGSITTLLGLFAGFVGTSPIDGRTRFTFGFHGLDNGFNVIVVVIGAFAISEMLNSVGGKASVKQATTFSKRTGFLPTFREAVLHAPNIVRSGVIGTCIGILPGLSGPEAALIAYTRARKRSKHPERFGKGSPEGIVASEASNNAVAGGALIPMLSLGIPGNAVAAVIMGGFVIHGVEVGPMLFVEQPVLVRSIILAFFAANILMLIIESFAIKSFVKILAVPKAYLFPMVVMFCVLGVTSINNRVFDTFAMLGFGLLGYALERNGYPPGPMVLGFILGKIIELNYRRSIMYYATFTNIVTGEFTIGTVFLALAVILPVVHFLNRDSIRRRITIPSKNPE